MRAQLVHVASTVSSVKLVRLDTGEYQVWDPGEFGSLLAAYDYILATEPLANALKRACGDDIELKPATVIRRATYYRGHLFLSFEVKACLADFEDLRFSPGFSQFPGQNSY